MFQSIFKIDNTNKSCIYFNYVSFRMKVCISANEKGSMNTNNLSSLRQSNNEKGNDPYE